jgi:predicted dehydrogenase
MNRRRFLTTSALAGAAASLTSPVAARTARRATTSDRLRVGFLGTGARAHQLIDAALQTGAIDVVSLCDAYTGRAERGRARAGGQARIMDDYRRILDDPQVDAVFIVTPDHWHRQMSLDALDAGKDVYLEKPMTWTIDEGPEIIAAVDRTRRILQVGSQGVVAEPERRAREIVHAGRLGQITLVRAAFNRNSAGGAWLYPIPPDASPQTVNWQQFLGSAPARPFDLARFFRWRCYWDYSGGLATDLFVHLFSSIHYVLGLDMPSQVVASGATHRWTDTHEVPDTIDAILTYDQGLTVTLSCTLNSSVADSGIDILGTQGALRLRDGLEWLPEPGGENNRWVVRSWPEALERAYYADPQVRTAESPFLARPQAHPAGERWRFTGEDDTVTHVRAFVDAVRSRTQPIEDARFGHRAAASAHLVNQAIRERRVIRWNGSTSSIA